jgi:hypothetical protein
MRLSPGFGRKPARDFTATQIVRQTPFKTGFSDHSSTFYGT